MCLVFSGTPRKGGNSEMLLRAALAPFAKAKWDMKEVLLSEEKIEMCIGCETCCENKKCFIDDDMTEIYDAYKQCDAIIISAPAY